MIYSDRMINDLIDRGLIKGATRKQVNPASINVRLGRTFLRPQHGQCVMLGMEMDYGREEVQEGGTALIMPHEFMLATTMEEFTLPPDCAAFVQGRSSIGRVGLMVQNAGFVDPGFSGHITLELKNDTCNPIWLPEGYPVAQLVFFCCSLVEHPYSGKYNGQKEATGSRMERDGFWPIIDLSRIPFDDVGEE
jgi:dCTP deaminase